MTEDDRRFWQEMRGFTHARIGLGRAGAALPTAALLDLERGAARARDAIHAPFEIDALSRALEPLQTLRVESRAPDRNTYLRRPDLGRRLGLSSVARLEAHAGHEPWDVVFVVADGLSAAAAETYGHEVVTACVRRLQGWRIAPLVLARFSRVALADEIAEVLNASLAVILLGERPGLSVCDSLAAYLTWAPRVGVDDSRRNCISNIHAFGLAPEVAAKTAVWLLREAKRRRLSGIELKEEASRTWLAAGSGPIGRASPDSHMIGDQRQAPKA